MMKVLPTDLEVQLFEEKMQEIESKGKEKVEVKRLIEKRMESSGSRFFVTLSIIKVLVRGVRPL